MSEENDNDSELNLRKILSGKNVVFLFGSGASMPAYKTLELKDDKGNKITKYSFEDLVTNKGIDDNARKVLYYYFFKEVIAPMCRINDVNDGEKTDDTNNYTDETLKHYEEFISKLISFLSTESNDKPRRATIFTTNYDLMVEKAFQNLSEHGIDCYFNDGGFGFAKRILDTQNYDISVSRIGTFSNYKNEIPTINLIKIHGSLSWKTENKNKDKILIDYSLDDILDGIKTFSDLANTDISFSLPNEGENLDEFNKYLCNIYIQNEKKFDEFKDKYNNLLIVNPNKKKFEDTVFQLQYYQQLRNLSFELEKENTVLVVLGFSFRDEHIRDIIKRSLSNPTLKVIVITYSSESKEDIEKIMGNSRIDYYPDFNIINKANDDKKGNFPYLNSLFKREKQYEK